MSENELRQRIYDELGISKFLQADFKELVRISRTKDYDVLKYCVLSCLASERVKNIAYEIAHVDNTKKRYVTKSDLVCIVNSEYGIGLNKLYKILEEMERNGDIKVIREGKRHLIEVL